MKCKLLTVTLLTCCMQSAIANAKADDIKVCPNVAAIQAVGVNQAEFGSIGGWAAMSTNKYGTDNLWMFVVLVGAAHNAMDAISIANAAIPTMTAVEPTAKKDDDNKWACLYSSDKYIGLAVTPFKSSSVKSLAARYKKV